MEQNLWQSEIAQDEGSWFEFIRLEYNTCMSNYKQKGPKYKIAAKDNHLAKTDQQAKEIVNILESHELPANREHESVNKLKHIRVGAEEDKKQAQVLNLQNSKNPIYPIICRQKFIACL